MKYTTSHITARHLITIAFSVQIIYLQSNLKKALISPYCPSEAALVSHDEGVVLGGPVWECWAASWASAWAVLYCSKNWDPVVPVLAPLGSPTSPKPLLSMLTCSVGRITQTIILTE